MSADRRTLIIAAVAMVALLLVGIVGASLFTRSACEVIALEGVEAGPSGGDVGTVLEATLGVATDEGRRLLDGLAALSGAEGSAEGAAGVADATSLTELDGATAATGRTLTVVQEPGDAVDAVRFGGDATVVGDGASLYTLALVNELTGQVDALASLQGDLAAQDCTDTATVGEPLAFHLHADDGRLLLFRIHDDGDAPQLQVRGPEGPIWEAEVEVGSGPPGVLAQRLAARLGSGLVVAARRSLEDEAAPALAAHDLDDGDQRWTVSPAELVAHAPSGDTALVPRVVAVEDDLVLVSLAREPEADEEVDASVLVGLDPTDGEVRFSGTDVGGSTPRLVGAREDGLVLVTGEDLDELVTLDTVSGETTTLHTASGPVAGAAITEDGVLFAADGEITRLRAGEDGVTVEMPAAVADVAAHGGRIGLLLAGDEQAVLVTLETDGA